MIGFRYDAQPNVAVALQMRAFLAKVIIELLKSGITGGIDQRYIDLAGFQGLEKLENRIPLWERKGKKSKRGGCIDGSPAV